MDLDGDKDLQHEKCKLLYTKLLMSITPLQSGFVRMQSNTNMHMICLLHYVTSTLIRYGKEHLTDTKLRKLLNNLPNNITLGVYSEPPQCMPDDVKSESTITAYHKYYAVYKKDFAKWTDRPVPQFMEA